MSKQLFSLVLAVLLCSYSAFAQNPKQHLKAGKEFVEVGNYKDAIAQFSKAIDLLPSNADAYLLRANCYISIGDYAAALADANRANTFEDNTETRALIGQSQFLLGNYTEALENLNQSIKKKKSNQLAWQYKIRTLISQEKFQEAVQPCTELLNIKKSSDNYYLNGIVQENLGMFDKAEVSYRKSIGEDKRYADAYVALGNLLIRLNRPDKAMETCQTLLKISPDNTPAYVVRSKVYVKKLDYPSAINDLSKCILLKPDDAQFYFIRGNYYQEFTQHQNAINDYNKVLQLNAKNSEAYYKRAYSFEQIANYKAAIKDYEMLASLSDYDVNARKRLDEVKQRLFELNRETEKPEIKIVDPVTSTLQLNVPKNAKKIIIKGRVTDQSELQSLKINNDIIPVLKNELGYEFLVQTAIDSLDQVTFTAVDVYNNMQVVSYKLFRTEIDAPTVKLSAPVTSDNGEMYLDNNESTIYVEGKISDESQIRSILIDGMLASFRPDELNPTFAANINVANKNVLSVQVTDVFGNQSTTEYKLNRDGSGVTTDNPMGKTWVVFIENSNYQTFASLEGPIKDVSLMKSALTKYKVSNIIHKKDLSKKEMERFFSIELRDLIRSNRVNSIMLWYAGHGKFVNETGYWIPIDANRDDEFTYFNINALKASMQAYNPVVHTLVVTDACESGPTFYQAMRDAPKERTCNDWEATKFKSSQVFSSAGYELAADNSQFTRTFANALANNPNACIPIENIVSKVSVAVSKNNQQKPKFGKIAGFEDEDGTFFFISK